MKIRLFPPLVMVIFAGLMYILDRWLPFGEFDFFGRRILAVFFVVLGFLVMFLAVFQFVRAKTTANPIQLKKTRSLVTRGIYKYTRNPMYLGMLLLLLAFGLELGNAFNTLVAAGFVSYINRFQIRYEEQALTELFGKRYQQYCQATRRWF